MLACAEAALMLWRGRSGGSIACRAMPLYALRCAKFRAR